MTKKTPTNCLSAITDESVSVDSDARGTNAYAAKSSAFIILLVLQTSFLNEVFLYNVETQGCSVSVGSGVFSLSHPRHVQHSIIRSVHWNTLRIISFQKENTTNLLRSIIPKLKNEKNIISRFVSTFPKRGSVHPQRKARPDGVAPSLNLRQMHGHVNQWRHQTSMNVNNCTACNKTTLITAACYQTTFTNESEQYNY